MQLLIFRKRASPPEGPAHHALRKKRCGSQSFFPKDPSNVAGGDEKGAYQRRSSTGPVPVAAGENGREGRGGRRHAYLPTPDERALLDRLAEQAAPNELIPASDVQKAYEAAVGHPVADTTIYRMLRRHGWRRVADGTAIVPRRGWYPSKLRHSE